MAPKRKRRRTYRFGIVVAVFFAVLALATSAFMLRSINTDIEDESWNITDPNRPQPTMPQPARTQPAQQTPVPTQTQPPIETDVFTPPPATTTDNGDE